MKNLLIAVAMILIMATTVYARGHVMKQGARIIRVGDSKYDLLSQFGQPTYHDVVGNLKTMGVGDVTITRYVYDIKMWRYEITVIGSTVRGIKKIRLRRVR